MSSKPAGVRDEWLHVIALLDKNDHERTPHLNRSTICEDKVLQLVSLNDATEYSYLENETLQRAVEKFQLVSFISTLSAKELSTFCGMFSSDEEIVLAAAQQNINDQSLTSLPSKQLIELVCIILECECSDVLAQFSDLSCIVPFLKRTETLLSMGGDDRLTINFAKDKLNKYMSSTIPRVDMLNRGSCTCSTISLSNYELAERERRHFLRTVFETASLCQGEGDSNRSLRNSLLSVFDTMQSQLMDRIRRVVGLSSNESGAKIVLFPSGSDAEYLPLVAALVRSHELADGDGELIRVINYVCAAGEVGR